MHYSVLAHRTDIGMDRCCNNSCVRGFSPLLTFLASRLLGQQVQALIDLSNDGVCVVCLRATSVAAPPSSALLLSLSPALVPAHGHSGFSAAPGGLPGAPIHILVCRGVTTTAALGAVEAVTLITCWDGRIVQDPYKTPWKTLKGH